MKRSVKIIAALLSVCLAVPFLSGCKDTKYSAYDSTGERYDYYLPDYVKICKYTNIEIPYIKYTPTEEDIDNRVKQIESLYCHRTEDPPRPCQYGDVVDIITTCTLKETGETYGYFSFKRGSNDYGQSFVLGVNYFGFPALDEAVVGMSQGETKKVTLTLPDPFYKDFLNSGKELEIEIYLNYIDEVDYSEVTDELYAQNIGYTATQYREVTRNSLTNEYNSMIEGYEAKLTWNYICDNSKLIKVPEKEYNELYDQKLNSVRYAAEQKDLSLADYLKEYMGYETLDDYYDYLKAYCENTCYEEMLLYYIIRCENLETDEEYYESSILDMTSDYQITDVSDAESFLDYYYGIENVREDIRMMYAQDWVADHAKVREDINTVYSDKLNRK